MAKKSHKQRAKEMLESLGWTVADVEQHLRHSFTTVDLWGCFDLLAVRPGETLGLQVTVVDRMSDHVNKLLSRPQVLRVADCLLAGWRVEAWAVRDIAVRDGSPVLARHFLINESRDRVIAWDGSEVLDC